MSHSKERFSQVEEAILITILYSDLFAFPLTHEELWQFLISKQPITREAFERTLAAMTAVIVRKDGYYCLAGREDIIRERIKQLPIVRKKIVLAKHIIPRLAWIPTVLFIGISGGLSVGSADEKDDIDLFVIVRKNTLFFTRFAILVLLQLMGRRRKRGTGDAPDKFCVNFLIDETQLVWHKEQHDVYTAREIAQLLPMFTRGGMYTTFLEKNRWIEQFVPNVFVEKRKPFLQKKAVRKILFSAFLEKLLRFIQISYMKKARTTEVITNHYLAFHPYDYRSKTLSQLRLKMQSLGLLTKF